MCGIFGFSGFVEKGLLSRMGESLAHRGPDGRGSYEDEPHRFFMGMRRLSIIDLEGGNTITPAIGTSGSVIPSQ